MQKGKLTIRNKYPLIIMGTFLIVLSFCFIIFKYYKQYKIESIENESVEVFFEKDEDSYSDIDNDKKQDKIKNKTLDYIAVLEIPKINLKRGLVDKNSNYNQVNYNIQILNNSIMPNDNKGNLLLAAHSGNSYVSFFRNLDKLSIGDISYIYYQKNKYIYEVIEIKEVDKNGYIVFDKTNDNRLTMVTCKGEFEKQIVIISKNIGKVEY